MSGDQEKIQFPCRWEFRLIADTPMMEKTRAAVAELGKAHKVAFETAAGESSGSGKYTALRVACEVDSLEQARELAGALGKAEGVRFLL